MRKLFLYGSTRNFRNESKKIRELYKYTQEYVADTIDVSRKWYGMFENNEVDLKSEKIEAIANIFNLKVSDLLSFNEKNFFQNTLNDNSKIDILNQGNILGKQEEQIKKIETLHEKHLTEKDEYISHLKTLYDKLLSEKDEHIKYLETALKNKK